jgi:hypothetical protein
MYFYCLCTTAVEHFLPCTVSQLQTNGTFQFTQQQKQEQEQEQEQE